MDNWYVYILTCADGTYYTGMARDAEARLKIHESGKGAKYTRSRLPVKLSFKCSLETKSDALKLEAAIKRLSRKEKEALIAKGAL